MYAVALFDIDGTLCDPGNGITSAMQYALGRLGIEEPDQAALRRFVGPPLEHSFRDHYGLDPGQVGEAVAHYRRHYGDRGMSEYRPYSGVDALLGRLASRGVRLGVVTAKVQGFAEEALRRTGLLPYFDTVAGRAPDEVVTKGVTLAQALDAVGVHAATVVMIGDREHDVHAARANGIDSIGVLYGFGTAEELAAAGATYLAGSPGDIERVVVSG
jgi:phosphoglycolate phosphatase